MCVYPEVEFALFISLYLGQGFRVFAGHSIM